MHAYDAMWVAAWPLHAYIRQRCHSRPPVVVRSTTAADFALVRHVFCIDALALIVMDTDLPTDADHYVHRAGRCGRAGRPGIVINITHPDNKFVISKFKVRLEIAHYLFD